MRRAGRIRALCRAALCAVLAAAVSLMLTVPVVSLAAVEDYTLEALYLFYENYENTSKPIAYNPKKTPAITEAQGSMELYAQSEYNGNIDWVANSGIGVVWSIEEACDEDGKSIAIDKIASIDRGEGVLHALGQGNGTVRVRCMARDYDVHSDMTVAIKGNSGVPYVTKLQILDQDGSALTNDDNIRIDSKDYGTEHKFYAKVTYKDPITKETEVKNTKDGDTIPNIRWSTSGDSKVAYVNEDTGAFIAQTTGTIRLTCSITGAGQLGDTIAEYVTVQCGGDTLDPSIDYVPADELKVVVKYAAEDKSSYDEYMDYETTRTWYYTPEELEQLGVTENLYTLVKRDGNWASMKGHGVYFQSILDDQDLVRDEIEGYYFAATDDYNPGFVGNDWLFKSRYYYPNMGVGSGKLGKIPVAPMIATQTTQEDLVKEPQGDLSGQTRFRLCLGAESTTVNNAQQSIYNVHTITIILSGAPPIQWDQPGHGSGTSHGPGGDNPGDGDSPGGNDNPSGGSTGPSDDKPADDSGNKGDKPADDSGNKGDKPADDSGNKGDKPAASDSSQQASADTSERPDGASLKVDEDNQIAQPEKIWQAYEIMSKAKSDVAALDINNPLWWVVLIFAAASALLGGAYGYVGFRRQLNPFAPQNRKSPNPDETGGPSHAGA